MQNITSWYDLISFFELQQLKPGLHLFISFQTLTIDFNTLKNHKEWFLCWVSYRWRKSPLYRLNYHLRRLFHTLWLRRIVTFFHFHVNWLCIDIDIYPSCRGGQTFVTSKCILLGMNHMHVSAVECWYRQAKNSGENWLHRLRP